VNTCNIFNNINWYETNIQNIKWLKWNWTASDKWVLVTEGAD